MSFPKLPIIFIPKSHQTIFHARLSQEKQNKMGPSERDLLSSVLYGFFIIVEIADRVVDGFILTNYEAGEISNDWNKNVNIALTVFMVIGFFITLLHAVTSGCRIVTLCCEGDCSKGRTDRTIKIWMSLLKVLLEAFSQTIISHFYFGDCAKTSDLRILGIAFNSFSLLPFIMYAFHFYTYYSSHGLQQCDCDDVSIRKVLGMLFHIITLIASVLGSYFAYNSIMAFYNLCAPQK